MSIEYHVVTIIVSFITWSMHVFELSSGPGCDRQRASIQMYLAPVIPLQYNTVHEITYIQ